MSCTVYSRILRSIVEIYVNRYRPFFKIMTSELTDNKKHIVCAVGNDIFLCKLDNIMVICAGKSLIGSNNEIADNSVVALLFRAFVEICRACVRNSRFNLCKTVLNHIEKRLCIFQLPACPLKLRGGHHIHRICDFHSVLNRLHTALKLSCISHYSHPQTRQRPLKLHISARRQAPFELQ